MREGFFKILNRNPLLFIFGSILISRIIFACIHPADNFTLFGDSYRYDILSDRILSGDYNLDFTAFIIAPGYPYIVAFFKLAFDSYWMTALTGFQFFLISLSGIYLFKITTLLFNRLSTSWVSVLLYIFYPFTLYYNFTFTQETCFQGFFIIFLYYFLLSIKNQSKRLIVLAACLYSICFLIKSHILLFSPFIALYYILRNDQRLAGIKQACLFASICLIATIPNGINNYKTHGVYTISSYGTSIFFHNGNSQQYYDYLFTQTKEESKGYLGFIFNKDYEYDHYGKINRLGHKEKNKIHQQLAFNWLIENPKKAFQLKAYSIWAFFRPGLSKKFYSFPIWILGIISSGPIFLLAFFSIYRNIKADRKNHLWMIFLICSVFIFYVLFMAQNRFRTITLDPFYLVYASESLIYLYLNYLSTKHNDTIS